MSHYRRARAAGTCYFFTLVTYRRQSILCDEAVRNALRTAIMRVRETRPFTMDAWVCCLIICIVSGHYHLAMRIIRRAGI